MLRFNSCGKLFCDDKPAAENLQEAKPTALDINVSGHQGLQTADDDELKLPTLEWPLTGGTIKQADVGICNHAVDKFWSGLADALSGQWRVDVMLSDFYLTTRCAAAFSAERCSTSGR